MTAWPCIVEASYLLPGPHRFELLKWVSLGGVTVFPMEADSLPDLIKHMLQYTEAGKTEMDPADASLYWIAAETGIRGIFTIDERDFNRYRLPDGSYFQIL